MNGRPLGLVLALLSIGSEAACLVAFKRAADQGDGNAKPLAALLTAMRQYKWIVAGILLFVVHSVLWTMALKFLDVSLAYPFASLELIAVVLLSRLLLKETVGAWRWAGVAAVVAGTVLVGLS